MNLFLLICVVSVLAVTSNADGKVELKPVGKPFPLLRRGSLEEVIPKDGAPQSRIFKGSYAFEGQFPFQAGLLINFGKHRTFAWCGGTILSNQWILTAAHCTSGAIDIQIRLGSTLKNSPRIIRWAYQNHVHPDWNSDGLDIALLKMMRVNLDYIFVAPAKLPPQGADSLLYKNNTRVVASGWGNINDQEDGTNYLKYATMTVLDRASCARVYGPLADRPSVICTNTKGVGSTCPGDSGGPLVLENTNTLVGLVTFGTIGNCSRGYPVGFSRLSYFSDWITEVSGLSA